MGIILRSAISQPGRWCPVTDLSILIDMLDRLKYCPEKQKKQKDQDGNDCN